MAYRDVWEMFLNLIMGKEASPFYGVDITHMRSEDNQEYEGSSKSNWEIWEIKMMV